MSKDTVLISIRVLRGSGHVEEDQPSIMGFIDYNLIEFYSGVHAAYIRMVSETHKSHDKYHPQLTDTNLTVTAASTQSIFSLSC